MGVLLARRGALREALAHFEAAASLDPNNAKAWNNRANALRGLRRPDEARQAYERAAALAPRDPDPLNGLGTLAVQSGRSDEAAALFRRALELAPEMGEARLNLAVALAQARPRAPRRSPSWTAFSALRPAASWRTRRRDCGGSSAASDPKP